MNVRNALHLAVRRLLDPIGIRIIRISRNRVRGIDPLRDLFWLIGRKTNPIIFDVGANDGETVREFLAAFPSARIVAFEPHRPCYEILQKQFAGVPSIRIENIALGDQPGISRLNVYSGNRMNSLLELDNAEGNLMSDKFANVGMETIDVGTLDQFCAAQNTAYIDILKIDTQGFDLKVLKGASDLLRRRLIKTILIEANFVPMYKDQPKFSDLHDLLCSFGYHLVDFYNQTRNNGYTAWCDACYVSD